jgi:putative DNA primase/helicase
MIDPSPSHEHLTDLGNAKRFVAWFGQDLRYCPAWKKWLIWDGRRWAVDTKGRVVQLAKQAVRVMYVWASKIIAEAVKIADPVRRDARVEYGEDLANFARRSESRYRIEAMIALAQTEARIPVTPNELDADSWLLAVENGTVDLRTGQLREHRREDLITKLAPVNYDPSAICPTWLQFLERVMAGDADRIHFIQNAVGYALTGSNREQVIFILYGLGANGKSTFLTVLLNLLGDYGMTTPTDTLLAKKNEGPRNDLARLKGARFVCAVETEDGKRFAEALVKQMTGGDRIAARFLYGEFFEFEPDFKVFLAVNHKPMIQGTDHAIWRRIRIIPFDVTIPDEEQDKTLKDKLVAELPGILRWAVEGCLMWQREGLGSPEAVKAATGAYRSEMDVFKQFVGECCELGEGKDTSAADLYEAYRTWCDDMGVRYPLSKQEFGKRLLELGLEPARDRGGDEGELRRVWRGIGLRGDTGDEGDTSSGKSSYEGDREEVPEHRVTSVTYITQADKEFWEEPVDVEAAQAVVERLKPWERPEL